MRDIGMAIESFLFRKSFKILLLGLMTFCLFQDSQSRAYELQNEYGYNNSYDYEQVFVIDTAIKPISFSFSSSAGSKSSCFSSQYHSVTAHTPAQSGWDQHSAGDKPDLGIVVGFTIPLSNSKSTRGSSSLTEQAHFSLRQPHFTAKSANKLRSDNQAYNCHNDKSYLTFR